MPTTVVNRKHTATYDVYIGRPSKWGNPYKIGMRVAGIDHPITRVEAVQLYEALILADPELLDDLPTLKGKILGCWCDPLPCHGHVLARLADAC
jgi:hypothetical protein